MESTKEEKTKVEPLEIESLEQAPVKVEEKPKINVDADSKVVNDNMISDDEFFDDFFEDE